MFPRESPGRFVAVVQRFHHSDQNAPPKKRVDEHRGARTLLTPFYWMAVNKVFGRLTICEVDANDGVIEVRDCCSCGRKLLVKWRLSENYCSFTSVE